MKKALSFVSVLALMLSLLAIVPASAGAAVDANNLPDTAKVVWDFSDLENGVEYTDADEIGQSIYNPADNAGKLAGSAYKLAGSAKGLKITNVTGDWKVPFAFDLSKTSARTDWTDGTVLWYYVDASEATANCNLDIQFADDNELFRVDADQQSGAKAAHGTVYRQNGSEYVKESIQGWCHISITKGYQGWIGIELSDDTYDTPDTGCTLFGEGNEGDGVMSLDKISYLGFYLEDYAADNNVLYIKEIRVSGLSDSPVVKFEVTSDAAKAGEEVTVTVNVDQEGSVLTNGCFDLNYDPDVLQFSEAALGTVSAEQEDSVMTEYYDDGNGKITFAIVAADEITASGSLLTVKFTVKDGADLGDTTVELDVLEWENDNDGTVISYVADAKITNGVITVEADVETYTVTFKTEGESDVSVETDASGKVAEPADPVRKGYFFLGWFVEGEEEAFDFNSAVTADTVLTAKWEKMIYGDLNGDTKVTIADVRVVLRYTVKKATLDDKQLVLADVTGDTKVTIADVRDILRYTVKKLSAFKVETM